MKVEILPYNGSPAQVYSFENKMFIEGREGNEYSIKLYNQYPYKVCAVVSVDGLSIFDGKPAGAKSQGMILEAFDSVTIPGWKLNNQESAKFVFSKLTKSYAAQTNNNVNNVGVIGVAVYREKVQYSYNFNIDNYWPIQHGLGEPKYLIGASLNAVNSIPRNAVTTTQTLSSDVGTGFGRRTEFKTQEAIFDREIVPMETIVIYYDSKRNLEKIGIQFTKPDYKARDPFPRGVGCIPPSGWNS